MKTKFTLVAVIYTLLAVVWTGNLWMLLGLAVIYDLYVSKLFHRYIWRHNEELRKRSAAYNFVYEWVSAIIFATVAATLIHILVFQLYVIPTSSMEKSLLIGDYGSMGDPYFVLKDFGSYSMAQRRIDADYADKDKWNRMAVINTAMSGVFSTDRTIREYNDTIWHLEPLKNH